MPAQHRFDVPTSASTHRVEVGDRFASPDDGEVLLAVFDCIEEIREVACGVGGGHVRHNIRLSD